MKLPFTGKKRSKARRPRYFVVGATVVSVLLVGLLVGMTKPEWQQYLEWGFTTRDVHTQGDYYILANSSKVKVAGVEVGRIDSVTRQDDGTAVMKVRVQRDVIDKVGDAPFAQLRPATLLGGIIYMDIKPGGDRTKPWENDIPLDRSRMPTELSQVVQAVQPDALKGIPATINGLGGTLANGGADALQRLSETAPPALGPGAGVINALSGTRPNTDLPDVVNGLQRTTSVLAQRDDQIESIVTDLHRTTSAFAQSSDPAAQAIDRLPATLDTAIPGLNRLHATLDNLKATAPPARPTVQELDTTLQRLNPTLVNARPVVANLRGALAQTRPLIQDLVPLSVGARPVLDGLNPSLDRLNGPVLNQLNTGFSGDESKNLTPTAGQEPTLREEITPFFQGLANTTKNYDDAQGHMIAFNVGLGVGSLGGVPVETVFSPQQLFNLLSQPGRISQ